MTEQEISPFDIAIMDSLKSIIEVLAAKGVATHEEFALPFRHQMQNAMKAQNGHGAAVFQMLHEHCMAYGQAHALHRAAPGGSA